MEVYMLRGFALILVFEVLSACSSPPLVPGDLVGTYEMDTGCSAYRREPGAFQGRAPSLVLFDDSWFEATDWSGVSLYGPLHGKDILVSGKGKWSLVRYEGEIRLKLLFTSFSAGQLGGSTYALHLGIKGEPKEVTLWDWFMDPDVGRRFELKRKE
jgi:hypothetical protein